MPRFIIKYTETVVQEVVIEANDRVHAELLFSTGEYSEPRIVDAYDSELENIIEIR